MPDTSGKKIPDLNSFADLFDMQCDSLNCKNRHIPGQESFRSYPPPLFPSATVDGNVGAVSSDMPAARIRFSVRE